ncbi:KICSTOR complex protein C12orf66 homolog [Caerostris extrusa]|uniref:KICSTOR subunit 2 n=1 Tax=Caerostris extrusa TaxID=172846 RepID=A0AAV4SJE1_CAEEX|nr:KICSTOR complex protein C12orf66 homolog [Caerostris extrusa]
MEGSMVLLSTFRATIIICKFKMAENAEDVISKQQLILDNYFNLLGSFAFDKGKEFFVEFIFKCSEFDDFMSQLLKNYANFLFLGPKGFLRKDSSLKSTYESLLNEFQRLEEKHYITPVSTPTMSPSSSYKTPSPPSTLPSPSPVSACSEVSGSVASSLSNTSSVRGSTNNLPSYLGEDILENLASHLCGQLSSFVRARLKTMEFYEKMYSMSSSKYMKFDILLNALNEIIKTNLKLFHHPMLSPIKSSFSLECEIIVKLLEAEIHMQNWRFLPSLLCLHDAHSKLGSWVSVPKDMKRSAVTGAFRIPPTPMLYNWLRILKAALVSKFSLYFHEILSKQTTPADMKNFCAKASYDYFSKIVSFQKKYDCACVTIVLDTNGLDDYTGHGYCHPDKICETPKGLDSFPAIVSYPPVKKYLLHWPSVVMIMNNKEQEIRNTESAVPIFDSRMNATYFLAKIEARMTLVVIFESKKTERDTQIHRFIQSMCTQLRGNKLFSNLKPGSK